MTSELVTLLFTDLVGSTELLSRAGEEEAQRIFRAHRQLLTATVSLHGGHEVKWLGDGLMVAFPSAAQAIACAIDMQRASSQAVEGESLSVRVGLNVGEALRDIDDYFGTPVVVARRLCDSAEGGQIRCTRMVADLLAGRTEFSFTDLGLVELKGIPEPLAACEIRYEVVEPPAVLPSRPPMVGREAEFGRLTERIAQAALGQGGLATLTGEPGIGKTRMLEDLSEWATGQGAIVLDGRCFETDWAPPYGPFAEALSTYVPGVSADELRSDLGSGASSIAQLVPRVREKLPDVPEPVAVQPDEERFRLIDAVAQFLVTRSRRAAILVCLDDLQWADKGSATMLRHLARFVTKSRVFVVAAYRDTDIDKTHVLTETLQAMRREIEYDRVKLEPLTAAGVQALLETNAGHALPEAVGRAWAKQVGGNPFFLLEMIRHLIETGDLYRDDTGHWQTTKPIRDLGLPEGVQDVVARRLARLSETASKQLGVASAFEGIFRFDVVAGVAGVDELDALDALDEAIEAQVVKPVGSDDYAFSNAVIRHSLYNELSPSRQMRLHRKIAQVLEEAYGDSPTPSQAAEIASQYHRSATLAGAERGVEPALVAASHAQSTGAHDEAATFLRMALDMLPEGDERRPRLLGRLGVVLAWSLAFDEAVEVIGAGGDAIAQSEGNRAAAQYLSDAAYVCAMAGGIVPSWRVAGRGLGYVEERDVTWARLFSFDEERRAAEDPDYPGVPFDNPDRREASRMLRAAGLDPLGPAPVEGVVDSRAEALESTNLVVLLLWAGEYSRCLPLFEAEAIEAESLGRVARAARAWSGAAACHAAVGNLPEAKAALDRALGHAARLGAPLPFALYTQDALAHFLDTDWVELTTSIAPLVDLNVPPLAWAKGFLWAMAARAAARQGHIDEAMALVDRLVPWMERAPAWTMCYPLFVSHAVEILWEFERLDHAAVIERALQEKVIEPDFRHPYVDARLSQARMCALSGRYDEAVTWFAEARRVLDGQGARPVRAFCDYDEALMYARRAKDGDADRARPLLAAALTQFEALGMTGWVRRAQMLGLRLD